MTGDERWKIALQIGLEGLKACAVERRSLPCEFLSVAALPEADVMHASLDEIVSDDVRADDDRSRAARALVRAGRRVIRGPWARGRPGLAIAAEHAARGDVESRTQLVNALEGPWAGDAAAWMACLGGRDLLDAMARRLETPGPVGLLAAETLLTFEHDPAAMVSLCGRACEAGTSLAAMRAIAGAAEDGHRLAEARAWLGSWARRGVKGARNARRAAEAMLAARGQLDADVAWTRASTDDGWRLEGARASWAMGDAAAAHAVVRSLRDRPSSTSGLWTTLVAWAGAGDGVARGLVVAALSAASVAPELWRASATSGDPAIAAAFDHGLVTRVPRVRRRAAEAVARARMAPSVVPLHWV